MLANQMRQHLRVRVGLELMPRRDQPFFQPLVIFDDPVVNDGDAPARIKMRVGIVIRGRPVRGPAGVPQARGAGRGAGLHHRSQPLINAARFLPQLQLRAVEHGHARAVVAAIFQPAQSFEEYWPG